MKKGDVISQERMRVVKQGVERKKGLDLESQVSVDTLKTIIKGQCSLPWI